MTIRAIFMGTPDFAVPSLEAAVKNGWDLVVVTQPDRKVGRKRIVTPPPLKVAALGFDIPVLQPERARDGDVVEQLADFHPDLLITAAYGQLLPRTILQLPKMGAVNIHASLLPRWRGAAPIHRAIMAGDAETGVTLMEMVAKLDAGPMIDWRRTPIGADDTVGTVHDRLALLGAELVRSALPRYAAGEIGARPQPEDGITYASKIERADEFVNWDRPCQEIYRQLRGLSPWPGATAQLKTGELVKLWSARIPDGSYQLPAGHIEKIDGQILVGTADFALCLTEVQTAGKRRMAAVNWLSGLQTAIFCVNSSEAVE